MVEAVVDSLGDVPVDDLVERTPLLSNTRSARVEPIHTRKGRCWCCWEETESRSNPLIRVCWGCKDPDLQFVHQECIDKYITALPSPPPVPAPWSLVERGAWGSPDSTTRTASRTVNEVAPFPEPEDFVDILNTHSTTDTALLSEASSAVATAPSSSSSTTSASTPPPPEPPSCSRYRCSRCTDPYTVTVKPISPFRVLRQDLFLFHAMLLMFLCIIALTLCCIILFVQHVGKASPLFEMPFFTITMAEFAVVMMCACHCLFFFTMRVVLDTCEGHTKKHVHSVNYGSCVSTLDDCVQPVGENAV
ncbi:hypothetical protein HDU85_001229 [Gaertneriomyces sp. JEL0708]|nr:hypothetical protein HDU85_001229 [Gaertneriomyces sp. JEL0708]